MDSFRKTGATPPRWDEGFVDGAALPHLPDTDFEDFVDTMKEDYATFVETSAGPASAGLAPAIPASARTSAQELQFQQGQSQ